MKNTIKFILLLLNDIYWIFKISKEEFFDIVEILSFGLVINAIYGLTNNWNLKDFFVIILALYLALKVKKVKKDIR